MIGKKCSIETHEKMSKAAMCKMKRIV